MVGPCKLKLGMSLGSGEVGGKRIPCIKKSQQMEGHRSRHILLGGLIHGNREKAPILAKWPQKQTLWLRLARAAGVLGTHPLCSAVNSAWHVIIGC